MDAARIWKIWTTQFFLINIRETLHNTFSLYKYQILYKAFLVTNFTSHSFAVEEGRYDKYINTQTYNFRHYSNHMLKIIDHWSILFNTWSSIGNDINISILQAATFSL